MTNTEDVTFFISEEQIHCGLLQNHNKQEEEKHHNGAALSPGFVSAMLLLNCCVKEALGNVLHALDRQELCPWNSESCPKTHHKQVAGSFNNS